MSAAVVGALAVAGDPRYLELSAMLALMVGLFLLAAGVAEARLHVAVPRQVGGDRIRHRPGDHDHHRAGCPRCSGSRRRRAASSSDWPTWPDTGPSLNVRTLAVGVSALVLILVLRRVAPRIPGALVALVGGIAISAVLDLAQPGRRRRRGDPDRRPAAVAAERRHPRHRVPRHRRRRDRLPGPRREPRRRVGRSPAATAMTSTPTRSWWRSARATWRPGSSAASSSTPACPSRPRRRPPAPGPSSRRW